eukprot:319584-Alexandrium_andersonii.AAC.1
MFSPARSVDDRRSGLIVGSSERFCWRNRSHPETLPRVRSSCELPCFHGPSFLTLAFGDPCGLLG